MKNEMRTLQIRSYVDEIHHVQTAVQREMKRFDFDDDSCFAVKLALEESLVNAVKHGNKYDPARLVQVCFSVDDRQVCISVKDEGCGFDPAAVPDPTCEENLAKPSGRGIMLMRAYMDEVSYTNCGKEVVMVKRKK